MWEPVRAVTDERFCAATGAVYPFTQREWIHKYCRPKFQQKYHSAATTLYQKLYAEGAAVAPLSAGTPRPLQTLHHCALFTCPGPQLELGGGDWPVKNMQMAPS